ncbi:MAG: ABC transporter substrate-binding protein [Gammaproteobacteria bacterium]
MLKTGFLLAVLLYPQLVAAALPQRIVSLNLCTDQWLLLLAERNRIASLTWLSADPEESPLAAEAQGITLNYGQAEDVIPLRPDLILAGTYTARFTVDLLQQRGYQVASIAPANSLQQLRDGLREVAVLLGAQQRAEQLLTAFDKDLAALAPTVSTAAVWPQAILYAGKGFAAGAHSIGSDLLTAVGLRNQAAALGVEYSAYIDLETLLSQPPDLLVISRYHPQAASLATRYLSHPVLRYGLRDRLIIELPARLLSCTPSALLRAARRLRDAREQILDNML